MVGGSRDAMDVQIEGSVTTIETAFHVSMGVYQHPTENRTFYAPDREPTVDLPFPLWHISGLDNYSIPHPALELTAQESGERSPTPLRAPALRASFLGSDMRAAYYGGTALTGSGQNIGLLEYDGYRYRRLEHVLHERSSNRTATVTGISTDGTSLNCLYPMAVMTPNRSST